MPSMEQFLSVRMAYAGRFDASGRLLFVSDLGGVPQVWSAGRAGWPELVATPDDRAQTIHAGPLPGQLVVGADRGGNERRQLLLLEGTRLRALTDAPTRLHQLGGWSSDGRRISFSANTRHERWFDVYVRDLSSGETRCVLEDDSTNYADDFSPDGRRLLVRRAFSTSHHQLWLVDVAGGQPPRLLTSDPREARYEHPKWLADGGEIVCLSDLDREMVAPALLSLSDGSLRYLSEPEVEVDSLALSPDGRRIAYALNRDGGHEVVVRDLGDGVERQVPGLPHGALYEYWQHGLAWDRRGSQLAISWVGAQVNWDVWVYDAARHRTRQVTHAPRAGLQPRHVRLPEHVRYPTFDGLQIPALYMRGKQRGASPCVVFVHGGPEGQVRPIFHPVLDYLSSAGFSVLAPNVRGSWGYGKTYEHLDDVRKRMDSVADLAYAVHWLRESGRTDPERIAVYGGSYGGFMVLAALTTYPDLWAAGVCLVGIANFVTFLQNTGPWRRHLREAEYGSLERDRDFLEDISPIHHLERIRAPLLIIHGANDPRVPIGEAEQMVERLRGLGRTVEFLRLDDEGHSISKLKNKLVAYPLAIEFLRRHLGARRRH